MARLTNTPQQQLQFDLERRKSYSFRCVLLNADRSPLNLTNCKLRFVMKAREYDDDLYDTTNVIVNHEARILSPEFGEATFAFQAAELDVAPGAYNYAIVLWTKDGYSVVVVKGIVNLHANTDSASMTKRYTTNSADAALELTLRGNDVVNIVTNTLTKSEARVEIIGTGRPDDSSTLEATTIQQVANAQVGTLFISLDGAGVGAWAWRKRRIGWGLVEGFPIMWSDIQNRPSLFPPSSHTHPWSDLTGVPVTFPATAHTHPWADVTGKPATFPATAHQHPWSELTGVPTTFTPTAHTHPVADIDATGTRDSSTFLRGDGLWVEPTTTPTFPLTSSTWISLAGSAPRDVRVNEYGFDIEEATPGSEALTSLRAGSFQMTKGAQNEGITVEALAGRGTLGINQDFAVRQLGLDMSLFYWPAAHPDGDDLTLATTYDIDAALGPVEAALDAIINGGTP